jgi:hypothetical protein
MEDIKAKLLDYIERNDPVTFTELEFAFRQWGIDWQGNQELFHPEIDNIIFWTGWNKETFYLLTCLEKAGMIYKEPCESFLYALDGKMLTYPVVKSPRKYKYPHWLPTVYRSGRRPIR